MLSLSKKLLVCLNLIFMEHVLSHFGPNTAYEQAFQKENSTTVLKLEKLATQSVHGAMDWSPQC